MPVKFKDVSEAYMFSRAGEPGEVDCYLSRETGNSFVHMQSGDNFEELPDDVEDATKYVKLPDKRELDLGKSLVLAFAHEFMPREYEYVRAMFSKRGAYARFKDLLIRTGKRDAWHAFENEAEEKALRHWCAENGLELED